MPRLLRKHSDRRNFFKGEQFDAFREGNKWSLGAKAQELAKRESFDIEDLRIYQHCTIARSTAPYSLREAVRSL